ncbi:unnamed protein product [Brassica napus]|uniref:(rape) hypothetical protein n=1 Tax=Brassica napus TaxID=3708 RepID=A0A816JHY3_BRANA|nr:unnamed protein product [Brassica napus]
MTEDKTTQLKTTPLLVSGYELSRCCRRSNPIFCGKM